MSTATTFRAAIGVAIVFLILAAAAGVNHFVSKTPHPTFGLKAAALFFLVAVICGIWANYNRPAA